MPDSDMAIGDEVDHSTLRKHQYSVKILILLAVAIIPFVTSGCTHYKYAKTKTGEFGGVLQVEWISPDSFIYRPHATRPLYFKRSSGEIIVPRKMYTDGGSVPRPLWIFKNYSPWGYAPAFVIHDWLFDAKHCGFEDSKNHDASTAADVMSEGIKTLMESNPNVPKSALTLYLMDQAVRTAIAKKLWEDGECVIPPDDNDIKLFSAGKFSKIQTFDLDELKKK